MRKPLAVASGLENRYSEADLAYSPDGKTIIVGLSAGKGEKGALVFLSSDDLSEQRRVPVGEGSVIRVLWHSRINQVSLIKKVTLQSLTRRLCLDLRNAFHWGSTCALLSPVVDSRSPTSPQEVAQDGTVGHGIHLGRLEASHLHTRRAAPVPGQEVWRVSTPEG